MITERQMIYLALMIDVIAGEDTTNTLCIPSADDEGNDGGALFYMEKGKDLDVLPVL